MSDETALQCPNCASSLVEVERVGVSIDACPTCRGVWLDRGELDKILAMERAQSGDDDDFLREVQGGGDDSRSDRDSRENDRYDGGKRDSGNRPAKKRKRSMLEDLLDFG